MIDSRVDTILGIVAKECSVDRARLTSDAALADLDIPSLDLVQAIFAIEEHFKVDVPVVSERTGAEFLTVGDLTDHVIRTLDKANLDKANLDKARRDAPGCHYGRGRGVRARPGRAHNLGGHAGWANWDRADHRHPHGAAQHADRGAGARF